MCSRGEFGATWSRWGQPLIPIGVMYDPFVERALEPWSFGMYAGGQSILVGNTQDFSRQDRDALKGEFPYAVAQGSLIGRFRFNHSRPCLERSSDGAAPPASLVRNPDAGPAEPPCREDCPNNDIDLVPKPKP